MFLAMPLMAFGSGGSVADMILKAGPVGKGVLLVLFIFSIISWAIIAQKYRLLNRIARESRSFLTMFNDAGSVAAIYSRSLQYRYTPLARLFIAGYNEIKSYNRGYERSGSEAAPPEPSLEGEEGRLSHGLRDSIRRTLDVVISEETSSLEGSLVFLATTGSTTPFIGLFGTVWGVINAFRGIGMKGSASINVVAPGIAEALIATAAGLAAAIPAVMAYNYFINKIKFLAADMDNFSASFLSYLEKTHLTR